MNLLRLMEIEVAVQPLLDLGDLPLGDAAS
jgi:hypothetical protein